jgi:hypothetical protein
MIKGKLRIVSGGCVAFYCPGCKRYHTINVDGSQYPTWTFNGDYDKPTVSPSILIPGCCHSFITNGKIQFLSDCKHELAGQTVDLSKE